MTLRWITDDLATAAWGEVAGGTGVYVLDVRDLVDGPGNRPQVLLEKVEEGVARLLSGNRVVVCCDEGMSRSNCIAAGILARRDAAPIDAAIRRVLESTGERSVKVAIATALRGALDAPASVRPTGQRVLLIPQTSLAASALQTAIEQRYAPIVPAKGNVDVVRSALELDLLVRHQSVGTILYLAAPRAPNSNDSIASTIVALKNITDVCVENGLFLLLVTGWEVYAGSRAAELRATEDTPTRPAGTKGLTLSLCEALVHAVDAVEGLQHAILRPGVVYGANANSPLFLRRFVELARAGGEIITHTFRNGRPALDMLHVIDLARAVVAALEQKPTGLFHIGTGIATTTADLAEMIANALSSRSPRSEIRIDADTSRVVMVSRRAELELGWRPTIALSEGIAGLAAP